MVCIFNNNEYNNSFTNYLVINTVNVLQRFDSTL